MKGKPVNIEDIPVPDCGTVPVPRHDPIPVPTVRSAIRRTCGNCAFAGQFDGTDVTCSRDGRGFDNHPVLNQRFPATRGGCLHHIYASRARVLDVQERSGGQKP